MILFLFYARLNTGFIPNKWYTGSFYLPMYKKKGDEKDPGNYRGITILSSFTSCIHTRLTHYIEYNNLLTEIQAGFRINYSITDHIFTWYTLIDSYLNNIHIIISVFFKSYKEHTSLLNLLLKNLVMLIDVRWV